ncbi:MULTISPECIES: NlpC/P60 family protein [unclassified Arthrobacter]|uniref:NlpC/P60 family protein n=1 Tax=unclassified Arthrobacter TaxID=235627 RepID=UPI00210A79A9|nr:MULTISPECIES: NlpC/P60 family protein [unclassified Arthrobacter]MCQ9165766.1 C40 family peptidase [Arthrobacter sp. STN4]
MSSNTALGRHRAEVVKTSPISVITKAVGSNVGGVGRQAAVIAAASGLVLTSGIAANAATPTVERASDGGTTLSQNTQLASAVTAKSTVKISFATPKVTSTPAPVVVTPPVAAQSSDVAQVPAAQAPAAAPAATVTTTEAAPQPATKSGIGATIAAAALAQLGVAQDCTMLVTNSLAAAGINYHGWPAGYLSLGRTVSEAEAQPGDLIYYADGGLGMAHIAVYIGNGQAVHGGFHGSTVVWSVDVGGSAPVFIAMGH